MIIKNLRDTPKTSISRNSSVIKQALLINNEIPHITNFAKVVFPVGESDPQHNHIDMYEVILVLKGQGILETLEKTYILGPGDCVTISPKEHHSIKNTGKSLLALICFGVKK